MQQNNQKAEGSRFELWMVANLAVGMGQFVFVPMLVVPYVTRVTGRASDGGIVLAIIGLSAPPPRCSSHSSSSALPPSR